MEKNAQGSSRYTVFIKGELINLCIPNQTAIDEDGWADWFNRPEELRATLHGIYPNYREYQKNILNSLSDDRTRIVLLVCEPISQKAVGVVSLSNISFQSRSAEIAINSSSVNRKSIHALAPLEAMALLTQHGFDELGLIRISGGQAFPLLRKWNKKMELIGYRSDGVLRNSFIRGHNISDVATISCLYENYVAIKNFRGSLWGSVNEIKKAMKNQPAESHAELLEMQMQDLEESYFKFLFL